MRDRHRSHPSPDNGGRAPQFTPLGVGVASCVLRQRGVLEMTTTPKTTWIAEWHPEDEKFWDSTGKKVARRNLIWSIIAEHLGFSIWLVWSIVATKLPQVGFT